MADAHGIEDVLPRLEVACEGTWGDVGQPGQRALADEKVLVVEVYHKDEFRNRLVVMQDQVDFLMESS